MPQLNELSAKAKAKLEKKSANGVKNLVTFWSRLLLGSIVIGVMVQT